MKKRRGPELRDAQKRLRYFEAAASGFLKPGENRQLSGFLFVASRERLRHAVSNQGHISMGKGASSLNTSGVKKQFILCLFLCFTAGWISGCDKPVCTGQDLQGEMYGQSWTLKSGLAVRGRYGYVITLSNGEPDGNPCSFSAYTTGRPTLQVTVPAFPGTHPLNDLFDLTQVSFCAADALLCDSAASGEVRIDRVDLFEGTLSGRIEAYLDETTFASGCFAIRHCCLLEWLGAGLGADGSGDLFLEEQDQIQDTY